MKSNIVPTPAMVNRMKDQAHSFYMQWMELNWAITFITTCNSLGLGKERANRLFREVRDEMKKFDERDNYQYNIEIVKKEFKRLEIPYTFFVDCGQNETFLKTVHREKVKKESQKPSIKEQYEVQRKLKMMQELMRK